MSPVNQDSFNIALATRTGGPSVSVCIPTYNGLEHLAECISSIQNQTFSDFEVVICDDRSPDGTLDLARELAGDDERFRFISNPRRFGLVGNWNNCINQARGEWIKFVFQDDVIKPACIEMLLAACQREGKLFGFCERDFIFEKGSDIPQLWFTEHKKRLQAEYQAMPVVSRKQAARLAIGDPSYNFVGEPTVTLINKQLFRELGGFDEAFIQICDSDFWCRAMVNYGAVFVPQSLALFRIHAKAMTAQNHAKREFRLMTLDPLVLRYKFAFMPQFELLRDPQLTGKSVFSLRREFAMTAGVAWARARDRDRSGDESLVREWESVNVHYPSLHIIAELGCALNYLEYFRIGISRRLFRHKNAEGLPVG